MCNFINRSSLEADLCSIIRTKDKQIADYKSSGAAVSRREYQLLIYTFTLEATIELNYK